MRCRLETELEELQSLRLLTLKQLRIAFEGRGYNVARFEDEALSHSLLAEARLTTSSKDLFARAFAHLQQRTSTPRRRSAKDTAE